MGCGSGRQLITPAPYVFDRLQESDLPAEASWGAWLALADSVGDTGRLSWSVGSSLAYAQ